MENAPDPGPAMLLVIRRADPAGADEEGPDQGFSNHSQGRAVAIVPGVGWFEDAAEVMPAGHVDFLPHNQGEFCYFVEVSGTDQKIARSPELGGSKSTEAGESPSVNCCRGGAVLPKLVPPDS